MFLLFWALLLSLSLFTFNESDPGLNHAVSNAVTVHNKAGLFGAYTAGFLNDVFGVAAYLCPLIFCALGAAYVSPAYSMRWTRWLGFFLLTICFLTIASVFDLSLGDLRGGGMVGSSLHGKANRYLSPGGSALLCAFVGLVGIQLVCNISWFALLGAVGRWMRERIFNRIKAKLAQREHSADAASTSEAFSTARGMTRGIAKRLRDMHWPRLADFFGHVRACLGNMQKAKEPLPELFSERGTAVKEEQNGHTSVARQTHREPEDPFPVAEDFDGRQISPDAPATEQDTPTEEKNQAVMETASSPSSSPLETAKKKDTPVKRNESKPVQEHVARPSGRPSHTSSIPLPSLDLLLPPASSSGTVKQGELEARGQALMACLHDFDIQGELFRITPGPVVTMFEVRPAPGIRVNRIANLSDDLALALKAVKVRIQAPIPGMDTVGIEIPNETRENVNFREIAASEAFRKGCGPLTMILGKDIAGKPFMADLTSMPHLLVAGATGQGKSVCLNCILISLLYRTQPSDMQLLLVDPKRIEMAVYADEPHLVHPVVTEMNDAKNALDWAVHEMDRRYEAMARLGVRNVAGFNQKLAAYKNDLPPELADLESMPYLVIVIDELADLMLTAGREVETSIVRLAQLARAAGIHMILATQRPSVNVVTGLIKANFPSRISFYVQSKVDSRTILDQGGAERLLGKGDMLYKPGGGGLRRLHGPFLSDDEVQAVVAHWKQQMRPTYKVDFAQWGKDAAIGTAGSGGDAAQDPLYEEVKKFVSVQEHVSISSVQRQFEIGFNRAARIVTQLERDGVIGPANGSKPRTVVR
ncbi:MAG: DNA translocase FtsK 4TM domain-containing protein [Desulfovibrio sp.]|nr:DNA translocase FtsK 4TM domain-containing protein [Desulfovibrio sp.]